MHRVSHSLVLLHLQMKSLEIHKSILITYFIFVFFIFYTRKKKHQFTIEQSKKIWLNHANRIMFIRVFYLQFLVHCSLSSNLIPIIHFPFLVFPLNFARQDTKLEHRRTNKPQQNRPSKWIQQKCNLNSSRGNELNVQKAFC